MPASLEKTQEVFTDEAEAMLKKALQRVERRIRSRAIDEALRRRGWPPEITGSDIIKAEHELKPKETVPSRLREMAEFDRDVKFLPAYRARKKSSIRSLIQVLMRAYLAIGVILALGGLFYAPLYKTLLPLIHDPIWKRGFSIFIAGCALALFSVISSIFVNRVDGPMRRSMRLEKFRAVSDDVFEKPSA